jgi:hypothetical protein
VQEDGKETKFQASASVLSVSWHCKTEIGDWGELPALLQSRILGHDDLKIVLIVQPAGVVGA